MHSLFRKIAILQFLCFYSMLSYCQISPAIFKDYLNRKFVGSDRISILNGLYESTGYQTVWIQKNNEKNFRDLMSLLTNARDLGLEPEDYDLAFLQQFNNRSDHLLRTDSMDMEIRLSALAYEFFNDIAHGNEEPVFGYDGLNYSSMCVNVPLLLAEHLLKDNLPVLPLRLSGSIPEFHAFLEKIKLFNRTVSSRHFKEVIITSKKVNATNQLLVTKLAQLGVLDTTVMILNDKNIKNALSECQRQFGLLHDGTLRQTSLEQLNVPIAVRLQQLNLSLNYYRWLGCIIRTQKVIVVNIPSAYLKVYERDKAILEMKMVLGKPTTRTPTLTSRINEVILYPYWHVPVSIATKELLPKIKRNINFLEEGHYQVLDKNGKIMNPRHIRWSKLSRNYFPYLIRQSTGCDNSLGLIKLNFPSAYSIYLHDTPFKDAFSMNKRYFSHGCMRMEKPMELGHLILKNNAIAIDTLEQKGCLLNQAPISVKADEHMPLLVWYNPAGVDSTGRVLFFEDVYKKFRWR
jgi:L,D-transpeptidase YcbB